MFTLGVYMYLFSVEVLVTLVSCKYKYTLNSKDSRLLLHINYTPQAQFAKLPSSPQT